MVAGAITKPTPTIAAISAAAKNQATGVKAATRPSSRPERQAARHRRSGSGSAKPRAACPSHGRAAVTTTIPSRPSPHAPLVTGTSAYVHEATASSQRGAPAASLRRPTTLRNRHAPQSATGTASSRIADTAADTLPPSRVASIASGSTYGGAGTAVPWARACHESVCSRHRAPASAGAAERPPPLTGPMASRAPNSTSRTNTARPEGDRVGQEPGHQPGIGRRAVVLVDGRRPPRRDRVVPLGRRGGGPPALRDVLGLEGQRGREVADDVEPVPVGQPPGRQQPPDVVLVGRAPALPLPPGGADLTRAAVERDQGGQLVEGLADRTHEQEAEDAQQGPEQQPDHLPRQRPRPGVGQQRVHRGPALLVVRVPAGERRPPHAAVRRLHVEDHRRRHDHRLVAGCRGAPAEVDVVAEHGQLLVEATELLEHRAADEHPGGVDGQHGAHVVVLALVVLAALQPRLAAAGAGDRHADLEQPPQRRPLAQLRTEHVGLGVGLGLRQQRGQGVGGRVRVVVEDPDPLEVPGALEAQPDGRGERRRRRCPHDGVGAEGGFEQVGRAVLAAGVDRDDASGPGALGLEAPDHRGQPPGAVMTDDERDDALSRGRIHGGSR